MTTPWRDPNPKTLKQARKKEQLLMKDVGASNICTKLIVGLNVQPFLVTP